MSNAQPDTLKDNQSTFPQKEQSKVKAVEKDESFYRAGQWQLVWWKFRRHKLAQIAMVVLGILYFIAIFAEFVSPYDPQTRYKDYSAMAPTKVHILDENFRPHLPFIYGVTRARDPVTLRPVYTEDTSVRYPIGLFVEGEEYKLWRLIPGNIHLF